MDKAPEIPKNPNLPDPEKDGKQYIKTEPIFAMKMDKAFDVSTIEGDVKGKAGDYLCKGKNGEMWPIDAQVFATTYVEKTEDKKDTQSIPADETLAAAGEEKPVEEGMAPLSHDSSIERRIRKHRTPRSRRHMKGSNLYRRSDPAKRVLARLKRPSRHQPKPEVEETLTWILKHPTITEADLEKISDKKLFADSVEFLAAMALNGWEKKDGTITNGQYFLESEEMDVKDGKLLFNGAPLSLDWDKLYTMREFLRKHARPVSESFGIDDTDRLEPDCGIFDCGVRDDGGAFHRAHEEAQRDGSSAYSRSITQSMPPDDLSPVFEAAKRAKMTPRDYWIGQESMRSYCAAFNDAMLKHGFDKAPDGSGWVEFVWEKVKE